MKIFSAAQIKEWDSYTITHEPLSSIELMERAATACEEWLLQNRYKSFIFFCSTGNNGGDGLAIARSLSQKDCSVAVYIVGSGKDGSEDFKINLARLRDLPVQLHTLGSAADFPFLSEADVVVDAIFGTGLNKPAAGIISALIEYLNQSARLIISIDMPSGLFADKSSLTAAGKKSSIIKSGYTLTFQQYKLAFFMPENRKFFGKIVVLDIGLDKNYKQNTPSQFEFTDLEDIRQIYAPRDPFGHKGNFGYALLLAGSYGMMGAAVLSARSCLKSGAGKLTCLVCKEGYTIMQISVPEAMVKVNGTKYIQNAAAAIENFDSIGVGPGIGMHASHKQLLRSLFTGYKKPLVIDADALNILSKHKKLLALIPEGSILTPHPAEFERLFGNKKDQDKPTRMNDFERMKMAMQKSIELKIFIIVKGHHTLVASPDNRAYFNSTGNPGMATAGSGDVLTGILTGLLAQGYSSLQTCLLGVYLHGLAGDIAAQKFSQESLIAGDITACLGDAFKLIAATNQA